MTTLEQFMNGYKAHKGQCNLKIQPQLRDRMSELNDNLCTIKNKLQSDFASQSTYFNDFIAALRNIIHTSQPMSMFKVADDSAKPLDKVVAYTDGASFIFSMEVYTQSYYILKHYFSTLPDFIKNEYMMTLYQIEPVLKAYKSNLEWCISHSSFNPKLSTFKIFNNNDNDLTYGNSTNHCLDTRVNM